jgi:DNA-binding MarR family transcriptional regulator
MNLNALISTAILRALDRCDGVPMPEESLLAAVRLMLSSDRPTNADILRALKRLEADGYVRGMTDELAGEHTWTLTDKGKHRAAEL